jgi:hypothetical protein
MSCCVLLCRVVSSLVTSQWHYITCPPFITHTQLTDDAEEVQDEVSMAAEKAAQEAAGPFTLLPCHPALLYPALLCSALLCSVMLCYAMLRPALSCPALPYPYLTTLSNILHRSAEEKRAEGPQDDGRWSWCREWVTSRECGFESSR